MGLTKVTYSMIDGAVVNVLDFGVVGDGVTNDTTAVQNALDSLGETGGIVFIPRNLKVLLDADITIPDNVSLTFDKGVRGITYTPNIDLPKWGHIILNRSATIKMKSNSQLVGALILPKDFVWNDTSAGVTANWTGTAVTLLNNESDQLIEECLIIGFDYGISSGAATRTDRVTIHSTTIDCKNGIYIKNSYDVLYIDECRSWPYGTLNSTVEPNYAQWDRPGSFVFLDGPVNDWSKVTNCFAYKYKYGYRVSDAGSVTFLNCSIDGFQTSVDSSIGFVIENNCYDIRLIGCQAAAKDTAGVFINIPTNSTVFLDSCNLWGISNHGVLIDNGNATIIGGSCRGLEYGITINNADSKVVINSVSFTDISGKPVNVTTTNNTIEIKNCQFINFTGKPVSDDLLAPTVTVSSTTLTIPNNGNIFGISGTTNFGTLNYGWLGRDVTLVFNDSLTVFNGTTNLNDIALLNGLNFSASSGKSLSLKHNGFQWFETGRR